LHIINIMEGEIKMAERYTRKIFVGKVFLRGEIELKTGLHIGGAEPAIQIGEVTPVIKDPFTGLPYIPGSSLKGKLRSILETFGERKLNGKAEKVSLNRNIGTPRNPIWIHCCESLNEALNCDVCRLFGTTGEGRTAERRTSENFPAPLVIRDCLFKRRPLEASLESPIEVKIENALDRITANSNPRRIERVVPGTVFDLEVVYEVAALGDDKQIYFPYHFEEDLKNLFTCMEILQAQGLGGFSSRGYGKVKFIFNEFSAMSLEYFKGNKEKISKYSDEKGFDVDEARKHIADIVKFMKEAFEDIIR